MITVTYIRITTRVIDHLYKDIQPITYINPDKYAQHVELPTITYYPIATHYKGYLNYGRAIEQGSTLDTLMAHIT